LKPIRQSQVAAALAKYHALAAHFTADYARRLQSVTHGTPAPRDRFLVRKGTGHLVIRLAEVAYFYTEDKLVFLVTRTGQRHLVDKTLAEVEADLPSDAFFRANRATLVHIDSVVRCSPYGKGKLLLELRPPAREPVIVSQERAAACRQWLGA
jgi:two-component system LytT family response regulator